MYVQTLKAQNNQSFGMSMTISNSAKAALKQRLKNPEDIETLRKLIDDQNRNKNTSIFLYTQGSHDDTTRLGANMTGKFFTEGIFHQFINPLRFIKKMCKMADELELKIAEEKSLSEAIDNLA